MEAQLSSKNGEYLALWESPWSTALNAVPVRARRRLAPTGAMLPRKIPMSLNPIAINQGLGKSWQTAW